MSISPRSTRSTRPRCSARSRTTRRCGPRSPVHGVDGLGLLPRHPARPRARGRARPGDVLHAVRPDVDAAARRASASAWPRSSPRATPACRRCSPPTRRTHTRYRRLVTKAFTPKVIAELEPTIRAIATRLIDSWIDRGAIEFVADFAVPLPVEVIAKALNVPDERLADFKKWSDDSIAGIGTEPRHRGAPRGRAGRQRVPALLRRPARAAPGRAAGRPADRPAATPASSDDDPEIADDQAARHAGDAEHPPAAARRRQRDDDEDADRDGAPARRAPRRVAPRAGRSGRASTRSSRRRCACRRRRRACSASPPAT